MENWKPVVGFEGKYEVSDLGRVRSIDRIQSTKRGPVKYKGRVLSPGPSKSGHLSVVLGKGLSGSLVHALVLEAFIGPRPKGQDVRHLDGDPTNNKLINLCYGTRAENILDTYRTRGRWRKLTTENVKEIRDMLSLGVRGAEISKLYNIAPSTVSAIKKGAFYKWLM